MVLGSELPTVHLFLKYLTNLPNELKRRLKIAVTSLEIMCLAVCLKIYIKVKVSLSLRVCKKSLVDPREERKSFTVTGFRNPGPSSHTNYATPVSLKTCVIKLGFNFLFCMVVNLGVG
jgi:hypothetical protein